MNWVPFASSASVDILLIAGNYSGRSLIRLKTEKFLGSDAKSHFSLGHPPTPRGVLPHLAPRCTLPRNYIIFYLLETQLISIIILCLFIILFFNLNIFWASVILSFKFHRFNSIIPRIEFVVSCSVSSEISFIDTLIHNLWGLISKKFVTPESVKLRWIVERAFQNNMNP